MKAVSLILLFASLFIGILYIRAGIVAAYQYEREVESYWNLSEKASSLDVKTQYLDRYVAALKAANLSGNNAVVFPTPDNSFEQNFNALLSLQERMHEIQTMNVRSFEYQQAISQITAQEQGEAKHMLAVFEGIWYLQHHPLLWDWYALLGIMANICAVGLSGVFVAVAFD